MSAEVSVVVVTYNSRDDIGVCLAAIREQTRGVDYEAIVVDNASTDDTVRRVHEEHPWTTIIARSTNAGLSGALNEGVAASNGRFVMALNPDTRSRDDVLSVLAAYLREHEDAGVVAPKILDDDGTLQLSCRAFPSHATAVFSRYSLATRLFPGNRFSRGYLMSDFDHGQVREVDWVSGAAMMFPRQVFDRLGGWDAGYFMFNEDVDFCRRVHDAGLRVVYQPAASVYHRIGVSRRAPARITIERHKSMWRYYRKHMRGNAFVDAVTAAGIAARCGFALVSSALRSALERARPSSVAAAGFRGD